MNVSVRVRPLLPHEKKAGHQQKKLLINDNRLLYTGSTESKQKQFTFDNVFGPEQSQEHLFRDHITKFVDHTIKGYHTTIFAYGQTGSGKTYTIEGMRYKAGRNSIKPVFDTPQEELGIIPRAIATLYKKKPEKAKVTISFIQIYNEKVYDLLNAGAGNSPKQKGLTIRWNKDEQFYVENAFRCEAKSAREAMELFFVGIKNKYVGSHNLNAVSSRSHCIYELRLEQPTVDQTTGVLSDKTVLTSKLSLVDLAGSEKLKMLSDAPSDKLLKESININTSLLALGKVISALSKNQVKHVPYRESKLTKLLKHALGGQSYTMIIACISPNDEYVEESLNTLYYASRATKIKNVPVKNEHPKDRLIRKLREEIVTLREENVDLKALVNSLMHSSDNNKPITNIQPATEQEVPRKLMVDPPLVVAASPITRSKSPLNDVTNSQSPMVEDGQDKKEDKKVTMALGDKLVDSVNMLKKFIDANQQLRFKLVASERATAEAEEKHADLETENLELRDRLDMLEAILLRQENENEKENAHHALVDYSRRKRAALSSARESREAREVMVEQSNKDPAFQALQDRRAQLLQEVGELNQTPRTIKSSSGSRSRKPLSRRSSSTARSRSTRRQAPSSSTRYDDSNIPYCHPYQRNYYNKKAKEKLLSRF